jgi:pentatricopeptide repeat protein
MKDRGVKTDVIIYNNVISACAKAGSSKIALVLLRYLFREGIPRDIYVSALLNILYIYFIDF